ncbi:MAG: cell wall-binding repeat-containing protein, partial [Pseudolysinimonas sp.]
NYPDALSAGPAAIVQQGALLLVWPTSIPDSVAAELHRLRPQKIVIVGGPASVSDAVETQLGAYSDHVTRQNGIDRFEASRNLAKSVWGDPDRPGGPVAPTVFISTGLNFPDALDAGPAAGLIDAPVILVNGSLSTLDPDTAVLLDDLGTKDVFIAGGPGSVSPGIEVALIAKMGGAEHVRRFTGETRYEAAAAINQWFFPQAETVFLATGANFPDALAGAPLAGVYGGPIYLSQPGCIPQVVSNQITAGGTQAIWLLGGPGSISPDVYNLKLCAN